MRCEEMNTRKEGEEMDKKENKGIILFPEFEKIKEEVEKIRVELSMLLLERDELKFVICKNIETEYMLSLGCIEYKIYEAECAVLRLKRKMELMQIQINQEKPIHLKDIEKILDKEFAEYRKRLADQLEKLNDALRHSELERLSDKDTKELKSLYRKIVKSLHPDINPGVTDEEKELLQHAVEAYKNGNLPMLRMIWSMVKDEVLPSNKDDAMSQLLKDKKQLEESCHTLRLEIEKIKSEYPYTMKEILADEEKKANKKKELEDILQQYKEAITLYEERIAEMMRCIDE